MEKYISEIAFIVHVERASARARVCGATRENSAKLRRVARPFATHFRHFCQEIPRVADVRSFVSRMKPRGSRRDYERIRRPRGRQGCAKSLYQFDAILG